MRRIATALTLGAVCASLPARADDAPIVVSPVETTDPTAGAPPPVQPAAARPPRSHVPDYVALGVTSVLAVGMAGAFWQHRRLTERLVDDTWQLDVDFDKHQAMNDKAARYRDASIALFGATLISAAVTAVLFTRHNAPAFGVSASGDGGAVSYGGAF